MAGELYGPRTLFRLLQLTPCISSTDKTPGIVFKWTSVDFVLRHREEVARILFVFSVRIVKKSAGSRFAHGDFERVAAVEFGLQT